MYGLSLISGPASEPVSLTELKAWLRIEHSSDDTLIASLGSLARELVEQAIGRQLVTATWDMHLDGFPWVGWQYLDNPSVFPDPSTIRIPKAPLQSVSGITYYDMSNTLQTLATSVYDVITSKDPGTVSLGMAQVWPVTRLRPGAVVIRFVAGYGAASSVPERLKHAIKLTAAHLYEHRGEGNADLPASVRMLLALSWNGSLEYG